MTQRSIDSDEPPVVLIAGPTASGKSALAVELAEACSGTVINADSMQLYKEVQVLSARPSEDDLARVPHEGFGVLSVRDRASVGRWLRHTVPVIKATRAAGRLPIVVGGTGMYLKALVEGLAPIPEVPDEITLSAEARYDEVGGAAFRDELRAIDPLIAAKFPAADRQRLVRARAVHQATGRPLSDWQQEQPTGSPLNARFVSVLLAPARETLYANCDDRFEAMMAAGALEEARNLMEMDLDPRLPAARLLGVPELQAHLRGELPLDEAVAKAQQATRNFAKRQMTWFRHQVTFDLTFETADVAAVTALIDAK